MESDGREKPTLSVSHERCEVARNWREKVNRSNGGYEIKVKWSYGVIEAIYSKEKMGVFIITLSDPKRRESKIEVLSFRDEIFFDENRFDAGSWKPVNFRWFSAEDDTNLQEQLRRIIIQPRR